MDLQVPKVRKGSLDRKETMGLKVTKERRVKLAVIVHHPLEDPQGILVILGPLVKMELLDLPVPLDLKVILVHLEQMEEVETLERQ